MRTLWTALSVTCILVFSLSLNLYSQIKEPVVAIPKIDTAPTIDGKIDSVEWKSSAVIDGFEFLMLRNSPPDRTRAYLGYDNQNLYIAIQCYMRPGYKPRSDIKDRDGSVYLDDAFEVLLSPNRQGEWQFGGNAIGTQFDAQSMSSAWNGVWNYAARKTDFGWECEFALPFSTVSSTTPKDGDIWGALLGRSVWEPANEYSQWGYLPSYWHDGPNFGSLFFKASTPRVNIKTIQARGLRIGIAAEALAPIDRNCSLNVQYELREVVKTGSLDTQAPVELFNDPKGIVLSKEKYDLALSAGQYKPVILPKMPTKPGSYTLELRVTEGNDPVLIQRIPLDIVRTMNVDIRRFPTAGVLEVEVDAKPSGKYTQIDTVRSTLTGANGKLYWLENSIKDRVLTFDEYDLLPVGTHNLKIQTLDKNGKALTSETFKLTKAPKPAWYNSKLGKDDKVIAPWTPIKVSGKTVSVWNRSYTFDDTGLPVKIIAAGKDLLASKTVFTSPATGKVLTLIPTRALQVKRTDTKTTVSGVSRISGIPGTLVKIVNTIEFDGFVWTEITISGKQATSIDGLLLDIPLNKKVAQNYLPVNEVAGAGKPGPSTAIPISGYNAPVIPFSNKDTKNPHGLYWAGDEDRGLALSAEDDRNWKPADTDNEFELIPTPDKVVWRSHFADSKLSISKPVTFAFCWMATPIKPVKNWYSSRTCGDLWYPGTPPSVLENNHALGVRQGHSHEPWTEIMSYPGTLTNVAEVKKGMQKANQLGLIVCLYSQSNISSIAPEFEEWGNEFSTDIPMLPGLTRTPPQNIYGACKGSSFTDFYVWKWTWMVKNWGVNGMYLDGAYAPTGCRNPYHDHSYINPDGKRKLTYPIRAARTYMQRMVRSVRAVDPNFFFLNHGIYPFTSCYSNYGMTGEGYWFVPADTELSLDYLRIMYGRQWGMPMEFYPGPIMTQDYALPLALVHGIGMWSSASNWVAQFKTPIWQIWEKFGVERAQWVPYWKNDPGIASSNPDIVVSSYRKIHNILLASATNKRSKPTGVVTVNLKALRLESSKLTVTTGAGIAIDVKPDSDGILRLRFPEQTNAGNYVWLSDNR